MTHSKKLWSYEHQSYVGYSWPCKMLRAQSFPNAGYFWYCPYAPWRRKNFETQNINKGRLKLFQGHRVTGSEKGFARVAAPRGSDKWMWSGWQQPGTAALNSLCEWESREKEVGRQGCCMWCRAWLAAVLESSGKYPHWTPAHWWSWLPFQTESYFLRCERWSLRSRLSDDKSIHPQHIQ